VIEARRKAEEERKRKEAVEEEERARKEQFERKAEAPKPAITGTITTEAPIDEAKQAEPKPSEAKRGLRQPPGKRLGTMLDHQKTQRWEPRIQLDSDDQRVAKGLALVVGEQTHQGKDERFPLP